jgi:hypothetical protein
VLAKAYGYDLAVDGNELFWTTQVGVQKLALDDASAMPVTLSAGNVLTGRLAVDSTSVYFTNQGDYYKAEGSIVKVGRDGTGLMTLVDQILTPNAIAVDATYAYWAGGDGVFKVPLLGGPPQPLAVGFIATAIVVDDDHDLRGRLDSGGEPSHVSEPLLEHCVGMKERDLPNRESRLIGGCRRRRLRGSGLWLRPVGVLAVLARDRGCKDEGDEPHRDSVLRATSEPHASIDHGKRTRSASHHRSAQTLPEPAELIRRSRNPPEPKLLRVQQALAMIGLPGDFDPR